MIELITAYHGTSDIWRILQYDAILSPYEMQFRWDRFKPDYDRLNKELADGARSRNFQLPSEEVSDEALADYAVMRDACPNGSRYRELVRNLFVYLTANCEVAKNYSRAENSDNIGGVIEVEISRSLLRQSQHLLQGGLGAIEVPRKVELVYAKRIFISKRGDEEYARFMCNVFDKGDLEVIVM